MARIFEITSDIVNTMRDAVDDMIDQFGKQCRLVYPPAFSACVNCVYDPIGQKSSNRYLHGGPIPFDVGNCPMCNGNGQRADTVTENITMILYWNPKDWVKVAPNVRLPDGALQTKGYATDIPKIKRCIEMVAQVPMEGYMHMRYRLLGEPFDPYNIVPNRYFVANWERYA